MTLYVTDSNGYTLDYKDVVDWEIEPGGLVLVFFKNGNKTLLSPSYFQQIDIKKPQEDYYDESSESN